MYNVLILYICDHYFNIMNNIVRILDLIMEKIFDFSFPIRKNTAHSIFQKSRIFFAYIHWFVVYL